MVDSVRASNDGQNRRGADSGTRIFYPLSMEVLMGHWVGTQNPVAVSPLTKYARAIQEGRNVCQVVFDYTREEGVRRGCHMVEGREDVVESDSSVASDISINMERLRIE